MHFYHVSFTITLKLSVHVKILYIIDWIKQVYYCRNATFVLALAVTPRLPRIRRGQEECNGRFIGGGSLPPNRLLNAYTLIHYLFF